MNSFTFDVIIQERSISGIYFMVRHVDISSLLNRARTNQETACIQGDHMCLAMKYIIYPIWEHHACVIFVTIVQASNSYTMKREIQKASCIDLTCSSIQLHCRKVRRRSSSSFQVLKHILSTLSSTT